MLYLGNGGPPKKIQLFELIFQKTWQLPRKSFFVAEPTQGDTELRGRHHSFHMLNLEVEKIHQGLPRFHKYMLIIHLLLSSLVQY